MEHVHWSRYQITETDLLLFFFSFFFLNQAWVWMVGLITTHTITWKIITEQMLWTFACTMWPTPTCTCVDTNNKYYFNSTITHSCKHRLYLGWITCWYSQRLWFYKIVKVQNLQIITKDKRKLLPCLYLYLNSPSILPLSFQSPLPRSACRRNPSFAASGKKRGLLTFWLTIRIGRNASI